MTRWLVIFLVISLKGWAQIPTPEEFHSMNVSEDAKHFYRQVWSPFCPGLSLHDCTSAQAASLRREIARKFQDGKSSNDILNELQDIYGNTISMIPPKTGFSLSAYIAPFIVLLLALLVLLRKVVFPGPREARKGPLSQALDQSQKENVDRWLDK